MNCFLNQIYSHRRAPTNHSCEIHLALHFIGEILLRAISIYFFDVILDKSLLINVNFYFREYFKNLEFIRNVLKRKKTNFSTHIKKKIKFLTCTVITICGIFLNIPFLKYFHIFHFAVNIRGGERERASKNT
jgi:hypothetical protein